MFVNRRDGDVKLRDIKVEVSVVLMKQSKSLGEKVETSQVQRNDTRIEIIISESQWLFCVSE